MAYSVSWHTYTKNFTKLHDAIVFARALVRGGWLRGEVDVQDEDGSINVSLP